MLGIVSLAVVLAIVGLLMVRQMRVIPAIGIVPASAAGGASVPQLTGSGSVAAQSRDLQRQVNDDVEKALRQGAARNQDADK